MAGLEGAWLFAYRWVNMSNDRIYEKLDKIEERLNSIDITLERNTVSLEHHIRRTDLLQDSSQNLSAQLEPIKTHVTKVQGGLQLLGAIAAIAAFILVTLQIIDLF
jgi:chromosome segregation ATPase